MHEYIPFIVSVFASNPVRSYLKIVFFSLCPFHHKPKESKFLIQPPKRERAVVIVVVFAHFVLVCLPMYMNSCRFVPCKQFHRCCMRPKRIRQRTADAVVTAAAVAIVAVAFFQSCLMPLYRCICVTRQQNTVKLHEYPIVHTDIVYSNVYVHNNTQCRAE